MDSKPPRQNVRPVSVRKVTSVDVARLAGVNQSTVSRAFSDDRAVADETRTRVYTAARTLGYTPNLLARSLVTQRTNIVAIVMAHISSPYQPYILDKFIQELRAMGRQALVFTAGPEQEVDDVLPLALQYRVDALIVTSATLSSAGLADCARDGLPVILFNRLVAGANVSAVGCDNVAGGELVADYLIGAGHHRFAYIAGNANSSTNREREQGYFGALQAHGVAAVLHEPGEYTYESGYRAAQRLLGRPDPPDALFCASDIIALGALDCARDCGVRVPDDLSVIGFDDIPMAGWSAYALSTVRQPVSRMIDATLAILARQLDDPTAPPVIERFPVTLVARRSARLPQRVEHRRL